VAKAIDIGTSFIVGAEIKDGREVFTTERDAFFSMPKEDFAEEMLDDAGAYYITRGNQIFVVGEDALKLSLLTGNQASFRRPMAKGVLNPGEEEAISMLELLIEGIIGKASFPGEVCAATVPSAPCDQDADTQFHRIVIERCLARLGYEVKILNEALAVIFAENPVALVDGEETPFSGVGVSFGAGMTNLVVAWRAKKLFEMAVARGGDWIDAKVAGVRGVPVSKATAFKEKRLDLTRLDPKDPLQVALEIYYDELIRYTLQQFAAQFKGCQASIDEPLEWVIAGGTAKVPGFVQKFERALAQIPLPFALKGVRLAKDPLSAPAAGALVAAVSHEKKKLSGKPDDSVPALASGGAGRIGSRTETSGEARPLFGKEHEERREARVEAAAARAIPVSSEVARGNGSAAKARG
jgi:hypothetical protein